ncbi:MAG: heme-binding protein [Acidobacteria bacterium]|nr:heme-binding protein [Acidobacteriota bacterium]
MKQLKQVVLAVLTGSLLLAGVASSAELASKKALTLEVTKGIAAVAEAHAKKNGWNVMIAILDDGGNLLYLQRMDGVQIGSIEVAIRKAKSAVNFKRPTKVFGEALGNSTAVLALPGSIPFEGGLPIKYEGAVIGAIGVSGMTAQQDGMIAQAGINALPNILN